MIKSFIHPGLLSLYLTGQSPLPEFSFDMRCVMLMDILECLDANESVLPGLNLACIVGMRHFYCSPAQGTYSVVFEWTPEGISRVGLASTDLEVRGDEVLPTGIMSRPRTHPGVVLKEFVLPALCLSVAATARQLGMHRGSLFRFMAGGQRTNAEVAWRLGILCGNSPAFWLRMQHAHDLQLAAQKLGRASLCEG